ncbi:glycosyltransferase [Dysgonomonas capnocytophagoides]|uniref:Glycosyltransferase n=1 Tax=Dysgonomonas capnocytophagoides TaxID=45254 RepID=A0A4Y8KY89_9BACT|nr:glycosyltransferase [Dysgonomonas capnocytophagoides]TFD93175.1 glycosyltransferase [Dysgonomonas capnocytophagoides]
MISVCIATYNGAKYIKEQLESILKQLSAEDEIIISDDSSSDETLKIIDDLRDVRIKVYPNNKFSSPIFNFENALKKVNGDYVFLSDQDDIWLPNKVEKMMKELLHSDLCFSNAMIVDENLAEVELLYNKTNNLGFINNILKNKFIGATIAFKASLLETALPFPKYIPMHDQWLGLLAELTGKTFYLSEPLILYRRHTQNASSTGSHSNYSIQSKIAFRVNIIRALLSRLILSR